MFPPRDLYIVVSSVGTALPQVTPQLSAFDNSDLRSNIFSPEKSLLTLITALLLSLSVLEVGLILCIAIIKITIIG